MGWSEAHTNPEQDVAALRAEVDRLRLDLRRRDSLVRAVTDERDGLADALGWLLAEYQDLDVDVPGWVADACEVARDGERGAPPIVDVPVAGGRL